MSLVSVLPYGETLDYWWEKLAGQPHRRRFMAVKLLEVAAFVPNGRHNARLARDAHPITLPPVRGPLAWPSGGRIAVVVPVYARAASDLRMAERLAARLKEQSCLASSVIFVDDASPMPLELDADVVRLDVNGGPAHARNVGIRHALETQPDAIALTDMDCIPDLDWVAAIGRHFAREPGTHILSGRTDAYDRCWLGRYHEVNGTLNGRRLDDGLLYGPSCNLALRAEVCREVEFDASFPTAAAEDIDLCLRARRRGWRIEHSPEMKVRHDFGYDELPQLARMGRVWRQFRRYAKGERRLLRAHPGYGWLFEASQEIAATGTFW